MWTAKKRDNTFQANRIRAGTAGSLEQTSSSPDQRSGFDRLKDRVGISGPRSHQHYRGQSKDFVPPDPERKLEQRGGDDQEYFHLERQDTTLSPLQEIRSSNDNFKVDGYPQENESKPSLAPEITVEQQSPNIVVSQADEERPRSSSRDEPSSLKQSIRRELSPVMNADRYRDVLPDSTTPFLQLPRGECTHLGGCHQSCHRRSRASEVGCNTTNEAAPVSVTRGARIEQEDTFPGAEHASLDPCQR